MGLGHRHLAHEVAADEAGQRARPLDESVGVGLDRRDDAFLGAVIAQVSGERAGVDGLDADDSVAAQVRLEAQPAAPARRDRGGLLDDEAVHQGPPGLDVFRVQPVVADERVGHGHDLAAVRGIGEDLLVAGHGRVEDDLAGGLADGAQRLTAEDTAVAQDEKRRCHRCTIFPPTMVIHGPPRSGQPPKGVLRLRDRKRAG